MNTRSEKGITGKIFFTDLELDSIFVKEIV
jgi:hypothetical protein